jgi:hypothetical protein
MVVLVVVSLTLSPGVVFPSPELEKEEVAVVALYFADTAVVAVVPPVSVGSG